MEAYIRNELSVSTDITLDQMATHLQIDCLVAGLPGADAAATAGHIKLYGHRVHV